MLSALRTRQLVMAAWTRRVKASRIWLCNCLQGWS